MTDLYRLGRRLAEDPPVPPTPRPELERRWRRRRTRRLAATAVAVVVAGGSVAAGVLASTRATARLRVISPPPPAGAAVLPTRPTALAVGPGGNLYVADPARDQILERLTDGRFVVLAGTGKAGFSGDGGPAPGAGIDDPGGMAFGPDGTLYFADRGNARVRAVSPQGRISTVAGDGQRGWVSDGTPALSAPLNPTDVTFGPGGALYVATDQEVLRLGSDATFTRVAGTNGPHQGIYGVGGPAVKASTDGANGIAFDSDGNLYIAGFNTKALLMVTPQGTMTTPMGAAGFYPRWAGGVRAAPDGQVLGVEALAVVRLSPRGEQVVYSFYPKTFHGIRGFSPDGLAVGPDGTIYVDTYYGNGYTDRSAIAAIHVSGGSSRLLWEGPPAGPSASSTPTTAPTSPPPTATGTTVPSSAGSVILRGSGVDTVTFGTSQASAILQLDKVLGPPTSHAPQNESVNCGIDASTQWPTLTAFFYRGAFVGYSTLAANGQRINSGNEATEKGLRVGDLLSRAQQLYGSALTTSFAQGGTWFATTPSGKLEGYLTSEPNQPGSPPKIASIEAGSLGCPAASP